MSRRVSEPKSTSVPAAMRVAAIGCDLLAAGDEQRGPVADDAGVLAVLHAREQRVVFQRLVALAEVLDVLLAPHEAHVRDGLMNRSGSGSIPSLTRNAQNCRETWNCSLTFTALEMSMVPSASSGV